MTPRLLVIAALLCAVPATGGDIKPTPAQVDALTVVDPLPSPAAIDRAFASGPAPTPGLDAVVALAGDSTQDLGLQIRALRALPQYCLPAGCAGTAVHDALARIFDGYRAQLEAGARSPQDLLRLRAAMEALGATRSGLQSDVDLLTLSPVLLHYPSRDVQVTAVRALRNLCSPNLCSPGVCLQGANAVRPLLTNADTQVNAAINRALSDLARCAQP
jgi:hypothetical protein